MVPVAGLNGPHCRRMWFPWLARAWFLTQSSCRNAKVPVTALLVVLSHVVFLGIARTSVDTIGQFDSGADSALMFPQ